MIQFERCLLCGRESPTGLHVMGCLLCFSCEKKLLAAPALSMSRRKRHGLLRLYGEPNARAMGR